MEQLGQFGGLSGILLAVGWFLKNQTPLDNKWIPISLMLAGVSISLGMQGLTTTNAIEGAMSALMANGFHAGVTSTKDGFKPEPHRTVL